MLDYCCTWETLVLPEVTLDLNLITLPSWMVWYCMSFHGSVLQAADETYAEYDILFVIIVKDTLGFYVSFYCTWFLPAHFENLNLINYIIRTWQIKGQRHEPVDLRGSRKLKVKIEVDHS